MNATITASELQQFHCTDKHYEHWANRRVKYTDGVHYLFTHGAAWLVDKIALAQLAEHYQHQPRQVWTLMLDEPPKHSATLFCRFGSRVIERFEIDYTDFPISTLHLWVIDGVILLPSEY